MSEGTGLLLADIVRRVARRRRDPLPQGEGRCSRRRPGGGRAGGDRDGRVLPRRVAAAASYRPGLAGRQRPASPGGVPEPAGARGPRALRPDRGDGRVRLAGGPQGGGRGAVRPGHRGRAGVAPGHRHRGRPAGRPRRPAAGGGRCRVGGAAGRRTTQRDAGRLDAGGGGGRADRRRGGARGVRARGGPTGAADAGVERARPGRRAGEGGRRRWWPST